MKYVLVWGTSARHCPQHCGLSHVLQDEDVVQIVKKKVLYLLQFKNLFHSYVGLVFIKFTRCNNLGLSGNNLLVFCEQYFYMIIYVLYSTWRLKIALHTEMNTQLSCTIFERRLRT